MTSEIAVSDALTTEVLKVREYEERVDSLSDELAWIEEEYQSLGAKLSQFKAQYLDRLGALFQFNDMLESAIKAEEFRRNPDKHDVSGKAGTSGYSDESWEGQYEKVFVSQGVEITPDLRAAYREAMKIMHPDLAVSEEEKQYRTDMAKKVNEAYAKGNIDLIESLVEDFKLSIRTDDIFAKRLVLLIRQEFALKQRIERRKRELDVLKGCEIEILRVEFTANFNTEEESFAALADTILNTIASNSRRAAILGLVPDGFKRIKD
jgi:hypothetical protein